MGCKFFEIIYNFGRGLATSLPLLLVKQVVAPPSGENMVYQKHPLCGRQVLFLCDPVEGLD